MNIRFTTAVALVVLAAAPAQVQAGPFIDAQSAEQYLARDHLIGAKVYGTDGKIIADVEDLIVDSSNTVVGVVIGTGGFLGVAEKKVGVALSALKFEDKDGKTTLTIPDATTETLATAPEFKRTKPGKSLLETAREKALELTDKTTATTKDAYEKAKPAIEDAKEKASEAYEKAKEAASDAVDAASEAVKSAEEPAATPPASEPAPATPPASEPAPATPPAQP